MNVQNTFYTEFRNWNKYGDQTRTFRVLVELTLGMARSRQWNSNELKTLTAVWRFKIISTIVGDWVRTVVSYRLTVNLPLNSRRYAASWNIVGALPIVALEVGGLRWTPPYSFLEYEHATFTLLATPRFLPW